MREYACPTCGAKFGSRADLLNHSFQAHDEFSCPVCGNRFDDESDMKIHERRAHPGVRVSV